MYRIGFVVEQVLGHVTYAKNLQTYVPLDPSIEAFWSFPTEHEKGLLAKLPTWSLQAGIQARQTVGRIQRETPLDALFFHTQTTAVLSRKWLKRIPSIISLDATPLQYDSFGKYYNHDTKSAWLENLKWRFTRRNIYFAKHIVAWSQWTKQGLIDEYEVSPKKITVIPPGVDLEEWHNLESLEQAASNEPVRILFVGAELERKGGELLLKVYRRLLALSYETMPETNTEPLSIELHMVTKDDVVTEPGVYIYNDMDPNSTNLKELFYRCHIFCLPSYGDFLPMVLSEAGAAGMPSVTTRIAAIPEIVRDGYSGYLVSPGDANQLENALQKLITNPMLRKKMGRNAQKLVANNFDAQQNTEKLLDLLKHEIKKAA